MSVITKVFVVVLTVFAIAFSMATVSYVLRQDNYRKVAMDYHETAISEAAHAKMMAAQLKLSQDQDLVRISQLSSQIAQLEAKVAADDGKIKDLTNQVAQGESQVSSLSGTLKGVQQTLSVTQGQLVSEQDFARKLGSRNSELERRNIDLNDRTKELTVSVAMAQQQNHALTEQLSTMQDHMDQMSKGGPHAQIPDAGMNVQAEVPAAAPAAGAAVAPIRGKIVEIRGNLASISVGAADGVQRGMTFMIFRSGPGDKADYVATLEVSRVDANQAAGQIIRRNNGKDVRVGDPVRDDASLASRQ